jgi:UDPglucose 6-dehydrogenase
MKVSVIGTGYVGVVTGACLAEKGHHVACVDADEQKIKLIRQGTAPIYEPRLGSLLKKHLNRRLAATTDLARAVHETDLTLIAVGTPFDGHEIDLAAVKEASRQIGEALREKTTYHAVVVKSTVVPGTTDEVVRPILEAASGKQAGSDFGVGMNPEFLTEGQAVADFLHPDRIVLGSIDDQTRQALDRLYADFGDVEKIRVNNKTAETIKYASNALLATMISFSNELARMTSALGGVDIVDVMHGVHTSSYLSPRVPGGRRMTAPIASFLEAGCGFGGSCLPKDVQTLISHGQKAGVPMRLLQAVIDINRQQPDEVIGLLRREFASLEGVRAAVLGLAFKPDTDDMRQSPAIPIIHQLLAEKASVKAHDPVANQRARELFAGYPIEYCDDLRQAVEEVEVVVLVTRWKEFSKLPYILAQLPRQPIVVDGRRMLDKRRIPRYEGIGL